MTPKLAYDIIQDWKADAVLRAEFLNDFNNYRAWREARYRADQRREGHEAAAKSNSERAEQLASLESNCRAEWDRDPSLRAGFGDQFEAYVALKRNEVRRGG